MTISEVTELMGVQQHVLRFWESKFTYIKPMKRAGGRRYYRPEDVKIIKTIRDLLYDDGYTIKGVQKILREQGIKSIIAKDVSLNSSFLLNKEQTEVSKDISSVKKIEDKKKALASVRMRLDRLRKKVKEERSI